MPCKTSQTDLSSIHAVCLLYMVFVTIAAPLKNALDWASRGKNCWADKPAAIVSAGGGFGGGRSQYHLRQVGVFLDLHFINKPELFVQAFQQPPKFDSDGNLIDDQIRERLKQVLLSLQAFTLRLQKDWINWGPLQSVLAWRSVYNSCVSHTMLGIGTCNSLWTAWKL